MYWNSELHILSFNLKCRLRGNCFGYVTFSSHDEGWSLQDTGFDALGNQS
jgi:hypothetical protein